MNKRCLLNPEKNLAQIRLVVFEKNAKNSHIFNRLKASCRLLETMVFETLKLTFNLLTVLTGN